MPDGQLHVHPDLLKVVEAVVERVVGSLDVVNLKKCQERLEAVEIRARNAEQISMVYQALASAQGDKIQSLEATVEELRQANTRHQVEIADLRAQVDGAT